MLHPGEYTCRTSTEIETAARDLDWLKEGAYVSVARRQAQARSTSNAGYSDPFELILGRRRWRPETNSGTSRCRPRTNAAGCE